MSRESVSVLYRAIFSFGIIFSSLVTVSCGVKDVPSSLKNNSPGSSVLEVIGDCYQEASSPKCSKSNIPKYYRQFIDYDVHLSSNQSPSSLSAFEVFDYVKGGYLIPERIGYKFLKGDGLAGYSNKVSSSEAINNAVTLYEVFVKDVSADYEIKTVMPGIHLGPRVHKVDVSSTCEVSEYRRKINDDVSEKVIVAIRIDHVDEEEGLKCSVAAHLIYFGISPDRLSQFEEYYSINITDSGRVQFNIGKILEDLMCP